MGTRLNPDTCGRANSICRNTLRVDGEIFESRKKKTRLQKYPDTFGRGQRPEKNSRFQQLTGFEPATSAIPVQRSLLLRSHKGLTHIWPLSCGFDSLVGRDLHWCRRGRGFDSRSKLFSGLCFSSVTAAFAFDISTYIMRLHFLILDYRYKSFFASSCNS